MARKCNRGLVLVHDWEQLLLQVGPAALRQLDIDC
jgi:hypothetical protein